MNAEQWNQRYETSELVWTGDANRFLVTEVKGLEPGRALDVAAGEGRNALWLADRGWSATAVDFADVGIAKGRALATQRNLAVEWVVADVVTWDYPREAFDLVALCYLHLPWADMERVLAGCRAALAPGGTLVVVGHDQTNIEEGFGGPPIPEILYTADQVAGAVEGLTIERAERVERPVEKNGEKHVALDCLVRAK